MSYQLDDLFDLLPALHRLRDHDQGRTARGKDGPDHTYDKPRDYGPLRSLLSVLACEGQIVHDDIAQLYDDHFIETCAPWVIPYIGDLVGAREMEDIGDDQSARQRVALTLALRQRKGTLTALEFAMRAATGWPVMAVEYWDRLATTESLRRVRMKPGGTADLRDPVAHSHVDTALDHTPRSAEFGRIATGHGRWNLPNIGLHFYRQEVLIHGTPRQNSAGDLVNPVKGKPGHYRFGQMGADEPLFQRPETTAPNMNTRASADRMPMRLTRWMLFDDPSRHVAPASDATAGSFSIAIVENGAVTRFGPDKILAANLSNRTASAWHHGRHADKVLVDPELGRFTLPLSIDATLIGSAHVTWHRGRSHAIGGHERSAEDTPGADPDVSVIFPATTRITLSDLTNAFSSAIESRTILPNEVKVFLKSGVVQLIAQAGAFPTIDCEGKQVTLDVKEPELLISGLRFVNVRRIVVTKDESKSPDRVRVEDCTVLGLPLRAKGNRKSPRWVFRMQETQHVDIRRCIVEGIETHTDSELDIEDSIIWGNAADAAAIRRRSATVTGGLVSLRRCTVLGRLELDELGGGSRMDTAIIDVASDTEPDREVGIENSVILAEATPDKAPIELTVTGSGCVRYSYIPPGSQVPRRFACVPALADDPLQVAPRFTSISIADPGFYQMDFGTDLAVFSGADDGQEMGVGNRLRTTARLNNLARTKEEFLRFGFAAGPCFET
jgi:hypothetical protein